MSDPMMDRYNSDDQPDHEDWDDEDHEPQIMWGRVIALGAAIVLAFLVGRATASGGVPAGDLTAARDQAAELEAENDDLRSQLALVQTENGEGLPLEEDDGEETDGAEASSGEGAVQGITYLVKKGDNLSTIAKKFYDDGSLGRFIARANDLENPRNLSVGQKLIIPDRR